MAFPSRPTMEQQRKDSTGSRASAISSLLFKAGPTRAEVSPTRASSSVLISPNTATGSPSTMTYSALSTPSSPKGSPSLGHAHAARPPMSPTHRRGSSHSRYPAFAMPLSEVGEDDVLPPIPQMDRLERSPPASPRHREAVPAISRNVSFVFASPTGLASPPLGQVEENTSAHTTPLNGTLPLPTGTRPRSRRSSTALAVSVSLASRSRSRSSTPNNINPPHCRSPQTSPPIQDRVNGLTKQMGDFAWEEAFRDDDDDDLDMTFDDEDAPAARPDRSARSSRRGRSSTQRSRGDYSDHMHNGRLSDVFPLGHVFGAGHSFEGEIIEAVTPRRLASNGREVPVPHFALGHHRRASLERGEIATKSFQVVRQLGSGSFAVVYLVREIGGVGQEYALKCLSKKDLNVDQLESQMFEATIHLSLPRHENVVTLHQALQTRKWLFLLMEMCPGEDLFFWLEHSRDSPPNTSSHAADDFEERNAPLSSSALPSSAVPFSSGSVLAGMGTSFASTSPAFSFSPLNHHTNGHANGHHHHAGHHHTGSITTSQTPTTPSLLAAYSAGALLSNRRLRLISSMFAQMCEAVALCHDVGVSHRDIKPENFICCDSQELSALPREDHEAAFYEKRKVIVKLTDFGLATSEERNTDVECGSRPYMAFECRNNLGPDYAPAPADVWSLGIVLINMLFHRQPWADPVQGDYNFDDFIASPTDFLLNKFTGIGREVATFLAEHIFSLHVENRVSAREFGLWAKNLPIMIGGRKAVSALKASKHDDPDGKETIRFTKNPLDHKYTQTSLMKSTLAQTTPEKKSSGQANGHSNKHAELPKEVEEPAAVASPAVEPSVLPPSTEDKQIDETVAQAAEEADGADEPEGSIRSSLSGKRKKRGSRKGKAAQAAAAAIFAGLPPPPSERDVIIAELAKASETLAREMSKTHKPAEPEINMLDFPRLGETSAPSVAKKESKLKSYLNSKNPELRALAQKVQERDGPRGNLSAPAQMQHGVKSATSTVDSTTSSVTSSTLSQLHSTHSTRSHTVGGPSPASRAMAVDNWRKPVATEGSMPPLSPLVGGKKELHDSARTAGSTGRYVSPTSSLYTGSNDSMMTFRSGSSGLSSQSSASAASIASSKSGGKSNVKQMDGIPWELDLLPRQLQLDARGQTPQGDIFSRPPPPVRKLKLSGGLKGATPLESISERPANPPPAIAHSQSYDSHAGSSGFTLSESSFHGTARPSSPTGSTAQSPPLVPPKAKSGMSFGKMFGIKSGKKE